MVYQMLAIVLIVMVVTIFLFTRGPRNPQD